ncbi:unnamed protein product [Moneuplotes crassus]|uniref:Uncharacterized protein n=1 Tax=Euplotes crassus TaxID=5936 RepID=A0AAD1UCU9_EUPCR|nr:unnamed protein product [Moneuplotes crassus]
MPKLFRNKGQYSFTTKTKQNGSTEYEVLSTEKYNLSSPSPGDIDEDENDNTIPASDNLSPTRWLSKNIFETSMNEDNCTYKSSKTKIGNQASRYNKDTSELNPYNGQKHHCRAKTRDKSLIDENSTDQKLTNSCIKRQMANSFVSSSSKSKQSRIKRRNPTSKYRKNKQLCNSHIQNPHSYLSSKRTDFPPHLDLPSNLSPSKSSKVLHKDCTKPTRDGTPNTTNMNQLKLKARKTINRLTSSERSEPSMLHTRIGHESLKDDAEIADETGINFSKNFMDDYYASNGYFTYSNNRKEVREKDHYQDRLQTFVDEKLLEVASQISVKKKQEQLKKDNLSTLEDLRCNIEYLHVERENMLNAHKQQDKNLAIQTHQVEDLMKKVNEIKKAHARIENTWKLEAKSLYKNLQDSTDSYNKAEEEYQQNRQNIRMEMHDDNNLIHELKTSLEEGDTILASLKDKAKYSNIMEQERSRMINDRALLLKDLCTHEKLKYKKKLNTLPAFIEIPADKGKPMESVTSKIRHKLFTSNGKMRKKSTDHYTKRHHHVKQQMRLSVEKKKRMHSLRRPSMSKVNARLHSSFIGKDEKILE